MPQPMISSLDHVNIRTNNVEALTVFYRDALKLTVGPRPDFSFPGAWLYCGERAVIHLAAAAEPLGCDRPRLEHFALKATDFHQTRAHLVAHDIPHRVTPVPGYDMTQIHLSDPDGNHIELNFDGRFA